MIFCFKAINASTYSFKFWKKNVTVSYFCSHGISPHGTVLQCRHKQVVHKKTWTETGRSPRALQDSSAALAPRPPCRAPSHGGQRAVTSTDCLLLSRNIETAKWQKLRQPDRDYKHYSGIKIKLVTSWGSAFYCRDQSQAGSQSC